MTVILGARDIARRRLANQRLIGAPFADPVDVVLQLVVDVDSRQLRAIEAQARRYGEFLNMPTEIAIAKGPGRRIGFPLSFQPRSTR